MIILKWIFRQTYFLSDILGNLRGHQSNQRKFIDYSLEWGRREKVTRHPSADFLPSPHMFMTDNDAPSVLGGGGQDFVDTMYYCSENKKGMRDH